MVGGCILIAIGILSLYSLYLNIKKDRFLGEGFSSLDFRINSGLLVSGIGGIVLGILCFYVY